MAVRTAPDAIENPFLTRPVGRLFAANVLPMTVVMSMGGLLSVVDGIFVGRFIGAPALAAVSLAFPVVLLLTALTTLGGGGMSSLLARHLGAGSRLAAARVFAGAHGLVFVFSAVLMAAALTIGPAVLSALAAGNAEVAELAQGYLWILILGSPVQFLLGLHADALRNEGRAGLIGLLSVLVNLLNIGANYIAIVLFGLGVAGSALGTVGAQGIGLAMLVYLRTRDSGLLPLGALCRESWRSGWAQIAALGLPLCLNFIGMAVVASMVLLLIGTKAADPATYVAAYGVATRLLGFAFLPQMAIALTTQSITGNTVGAGQTGRALQALWLAMACALIWCLCVALLGTFAGAWLGAWFSDNPAVIAATAEILRPMTALYFVSGPILVLALHYQAMGHPLRTAALTLIKPWLLTPALLFGLSAVWGIDGLWRAFPIAEAVLALLAMALVLRFRLIPPDPTPPMQKETA